MRGPRHHARTYYLRRSFSRYHRERRAMRFHYPLAFLGAAIVCNPWGDDFVVLTGGLVLMAVCGARALWVHCHRVGRGVYR